MMEEMLKDITIEEFVDTGALWWINQQLHLFGLAIAYDITEDGEYKNFRPCRCQFRGFGEKQNDEGYAKLTSWMANMGHDLYMECD